MRTDHRADVVVVGAGQAGLAASACLTDRGVDHVILERDEVAHAWTHQRWDSLRLLTPNWLTRLPNYCYSGPDPDGFMTAPEVARFLHGYRDHIGAPVWTGVGVTTLRRGGGPGGDDFVLDTTSGRWSARAVIIAAGGHGQAKRPATAAAMPPSIAQFDATTYRNPGQIPDGRVLVVGASASGVQIADELATAGREVILSVGEHVRVPRSYRGMDIHWWMDAIGLLDEPVEAIADIDRARRLPSLQLVGSPQRRNVDLASLQLRGVALTGRLMDISGSEARFSGSLANMIALADLKMARLLDRIDSYADQAGISAEIEPADRPGRTALPKPRLALDLSGVGAVVWATGYRPGWDWVESDLLQPGQPHGEQPGALHSTGVQVLGLPLLRRRNSSFIDGVGQDAAHAVAAVAAHLDSTAVVA